MPIRTIIVDDERYARLKLRDFLEQEPDIDIVGEAGAGQEAIQAIKKMKPDLVFLDIQMPGLDGFQVLESIDRKSLPCVIFATAYDQYALRAFDVHALDYLLKPFDQTRFRAALDRARECIRMKATDESYRDRLAEFIQEIREKSSYTTRFFVHKKKKIVYVKANDVGWIAAEGNYAVVHASDGDHLLRESLAGLEKKLDPREFVRVNRSTIINLDFVKEIQPFFHGEFVVVLKNDRRVTVTRTYRAKFAKILGRP
jgi:two-component system, LytTR family, response regulator